jgi:hypothetical protein
MRSAKLTQSHCLAASEAGSRCPVTAVTTPLPAASRRSTQSCPTHLDRASHDQQHVQRPPPRYRYPVPDSHNHSHDSRHEGTSVTYTHTIPHHHLTTTPLQPHPLVPCPSPCRRVPPKPGNPGYGDVPYDAVLVVATKNQRAFLLILRVLENSGAGSGH